MAQPRRVLEFFVTRLDPVVRDPTVPFAQSDPQLAPGQMAAEAAMDAAAEGDVRIRLSVEAHVQGIGVDGAVDVGGAITDHDGGAGRHPVAVGKLGVIDGYPGHAPRNRRLPAQQFFDGGRDERRILDRSAGDARGGRQGRRRNRSTSHSPCRVRQ